MPSLFGRGNSSSTSVWTMNRDGVYDDTPAMAALRWVLVIDPVSSEV